MSFTVLTVTTKKYNGLKNAITKYGLKIDENGYKEDQKGTCEKDGGRQKIPTSDCDVSFVLNTNKVPSNTT